jgi:cytochrome c-type biogenesis protein CcmH/NrfG
MVTVVLFGVLGTFSVLAINSVGSKRSEETTGKTAGTDQVAGKPASERLAELHKLLEARMITQEEFARKRAEILQSL